MRGGRKKWSWSLQSPGSRAGGAELVCTLSPTSWSDKHQALDGGDRRSDNDSLGLHENTKLVKYNRATPIYSFNQGICTYTHTHKQRTQQKHTPERSEVAPCKVMFSELSAVPIEASDSGVSSSDVRGSKISISYVSSSLPTHTHTARN